MILCCFCFLSFQEQKQHLFSISGKAQGTTYSILYYDQYQKIGQKEIDSIFKVIDESMSLYDSTSLISQINRSPDGGKLDLHFLRVVKKAFEIHRKTDGLFDITVGPLLNAWGFMAKDGRALPDSLAISKLMPLIGMEKLKLRGTFLKKKNPNIKIDVNGIAQGYTVDVLAEHFRKKRVLNFLIELGGELRVEGKKSNGQDFIVGVERPLNQTDDQSVIRHRVAIRGKALTTSGSYQNYIKRGDERLSHIMDPRTGYPIKSDILSVTVLANDALTADGYDNALMAMGLEKALEFVESFSDLEAYFVYQNEAGLIVDTMTNGFKPIILDN